VGGMIGPASGDPYQVHAERVCALVTTATGRRWPEHLVAAMTLVLNAIADVERGRTNSTRYVPANKLRWLRGETTHDHSSPIPRRVVDVYRLPGPVTFQLVYIALGSTRYDDPGVLGSSSALYARLTGSTSVSDRVAHRWAACLVRAEAGGTVPVLVTNRVRREVERHRRELVPVDPKPIVGLRVAV